jgi:Uma2 family endonuclease
MDLLTKGRTQMTLTPNGFPVVAPANTIPGPEQGQWTYEDYAAIPDDGKRYEVVNGVLFMSPAPGKWHQKTVGRIFRYLAAHIEDTGIGEVYIAPFDVELASNIVVQPDVLVLLKPHLEKATDKRVIGAPDLVVEVASPSTAIYDRREKLDAYIQAGVAEYWIVESATHSVEVLTIEANTFSSRGIFEGKTVLSSKVIPDFSIHVEQFFT